jgi:hypothetical protein
MPRRGAVSGRNRTRLETPNFLTRRPSLFLQQHHSRRARNTFYCQNFFSATAGSFQFNQHGHFTSATQPCQAASPCQHKHTTSASPVNLCVYSAVAFRPEATIHLVLYNKYTSPQSWLVIPKRRIPCSFAFAPRKLQKQES